MDIINRTSLVLGLLLLLAGDAPAQDWRKIVPMKSTRADVEALFGRAADSYGVVYELADGNLSVVYSTGYCSEKSSGGWNVAEDVVISYRFAPTVKPRLANLRLDLKKFTKQKDTHTGGITYYVNGAEGVMYEIQGGLVEYIEYYPPKKFDHLYCPNLSRGPKRK